MSSYSDLIFDHYHNPQNIGSLDDATHIAELKNLSCGDQIKLFLKVENSLIIDLKYQMSGCAISTASISILSDEIIGKSIESVQIMSIDDIKNLIEIEISYARTKCATLGLEAIKKALQKESHE